MASQKTPGEKLGDPRTLVELPPTLQENGEALAQELGTETSFWKKNGRLRCWLLVGFPWEIVYLLYL